MKTANQNLVRLLQNAYSGEVAAAYAYRGHWRSLRASFERERIRQIEADEWDHRRRVGEWLVKLGAKPRRVREKIFWLIGRTLGLGCYVTGWFMPMYFAGRLEHKNVREYTEAAAFAKELGMDDCVADMMEMSHVESEHEAFFSSAVAGHRLLPVMRRVFGWS